MSREISELKSENLEGLGYSFDQIGEHWVWNAPTDTSESHFKTQDEAVEAAWLDATEQTMGILNLSDEQWDALSLHQQMERMNEALTDDTGWPLIKYSVTVRTNCEYSTVIEVEAVSPEEAQQMALAKARETDPATWDQAWAPMEAETEEEAP